jgi:ubiquinol-cytochrome c reductase cytochrome b subunit
MFARIFDWLDSRTGYRGIVETLLHEPLPRGTGWFFTTGSIVTLLVGVQFVTGVGLSMYYVPSPSLAYDSVRYIMTTLPMGWLLRGLHFWGASFLVVAAVVHMTRVFFFGSYKAPREVTWISGVLMLLVILGFALSGYLLPWDQKAYWATTVTINVARGTPLIGDSIANVMRGGSDLGALTLGRWFSAHVFLLPMTLVALIAAHIALMRKHGISGPMKPAPGPGAAFFPWHVVKDTIVMAAVFASLFTVAVLVRAPLDAIANPADADYIPRPEWYFLSLFQLLKYFPGPLEPIATQVLPGIVVGFLFLLPFLDRGGDRHPLRGPRRWLTVSFLAIGAAVLTLTGLGLADMPEESSEPELLAIAGKGLVESSGCAKCHVAGGPASSLANVRITRDDEWLLSHMADPMVIAPGVRPESEPAPRPVLSRFKAQAVTAYLRLNYSGKAVASPEPHVAVAADIYASVCIACHKLGANGGAVGPDLTHVGSRRDEATIRRIIEDPLSAYEDSKMPPFGTRLSADQINALAKYLATRK